MSEASARIYDPIAVSSESTVVAEYVPDAANTVAYQSEAQLERELIHVLQSQAYEYLPLHSEAQLIANLRKQLELLNQVTFSDSEWDQFFAASIAGKAEGIVEKTVRIQEDHVQVLHRDDGTSKNITLLDKRNIHNNRLQVINQYAVPGAPEGGEAKFSNRYDVTILVNGLPMVHLELKRRGVDIREAFNQIDRYQRDSFWAGSGLFEYVQLFVISNGTLTKYYSNTTRRQHLADGQRPGRGRKTSNSFEFTSWWADATNKPIADLMAFARTFLAKHTLLSILTRYCVLTADRMLLVMRPYQIVATERILQRIEMSTNNRKLGTRAAGGTYGTPPDRARPSRRSRQRSSPPDCPASTRCCSSSTARISTTRRCGNTTAFRRERPTPTPPRPCSSGSWRIRALGSSSPRSRSWPGSSRQIPATRSSAGTR